MEDSEKSLVACLYKLRKTLKSPRQTHIEKGSDENEYTLFVYFHRILMPKWGVASQKLVNQDT